jgi:hypothetical protein
MSEDQKVANRRRANAWYWANKERAANRASKYRAANKETIAESKRSPAYRRWKREYRAANKEAIAQYQSEWREANREHTKAYNAIDGYARILAWNRANFVRRRAWHAERRARVLRQCPVWADRSALEEVYALCPEGHQVDHIVPIRGKTPDGYRVSGLHVPWNLQYLPKSANFVKNSRMTQADLLLCTQSYPSVGMK